MRISDWSSDVCSSDLGDPRLEPLACDLESDEPPGFLARRFGGIVVTNYLHRPLLAPLAAALAPGGVLIYETFARGNERFGNPSNQAFLLEEGELLRAFLGRLKTIALQECVLAATPQAAVPGLCSQAAPAGLGSTHG